MRVVDFRAVLRALGDNPAGHIKTKSGQLYVNYRLSEMPNEPIAEVVLLHHTSDRTVFLAISEIESIQ